MSRTQILAQVDSIRNRPTQTTLMKAAFKSLGLDAVAKQHRGPMPLHVFCAHMANRLGVAVIDHAFCDGIARTISALKDQRLKVSLPREQCSCCIAGYVYDDAIEDNRPGASLGN